MTVVLVKQSKRVRSVIASGKRKGQKTFRVETSERRVELDAGDEVELDLGLKKGLVRGWVRCAHAEHVCVEVRNPSLKEEPLVLGKGCHDLLRVPYETDLLWSGEREPRVIDYGIRKVESDG